MCTLSDLSDVVPTVNMPQGQHNHQSPQPSCSFMLPPPAHMLMHNQPSVSPHLHNQGKPSPYLKFVITQSLIFKKACMCMYIIL